MKKQFRRVLSVVLCALLLAAAAPAAGLAAIADVLSVTAAAEWYSGQCGDNLSWEMQTESGVLRLHWWGELQLDEGFVPPWSDYSASIRTVVFEGDVFSIPGGLLIGCPALSQVHIPSSVTSVADDAFSLPPMSLICSDVANGCAQVYAQNHGLMFLHCAGGHESMGTLVFANDSLFFYNFGANGICITGLRMTSQMNPSSFPSAVRVPAYIDGMQVTEISSYAFAGMPQITSVTLPDTIQTINDYAFADCANLEYVYIPSSASCYYIGSNILYNSPAYLCSDSSSNFVSAYAADNGIEYRQIEQPIEQAEIGFWVRLSENMPYGLCITRAENMNGMNSGPYPWLVYGDVTVPMELGGMPVVEIASGAFANQGISSVTLPDTIRAIGDFAFSGCPNLRYVYIPTSSMLSTPDANSNIGQNILISSPAYLCSDGFNNWVQTYAINHDIPYRPIQSINDLVYGLLTYTIDNDCVTITGRTNDICGELAIPAVIDGYPVTAIREGAFEDLTTITSVTIPSSVTSIGDYAFFDCGMLESVTIPNGVTSIGDSAFSYCTSLTAANLPASVQHLDNQAFFNCFSLASVSIPAGIQTIGGSVFYGCSNLSSVTIPNGITSIGNYAFFRCSGLTDITIPGSVTTIGDFAFSNCSSLTSVTIQQGVTSLGRYVFESCPNLTSVTLPPSLTSFGSSAFWGCSKLTGVYYTGTLAEWCGITFSDNSSNPLYFAHNLYISDTLVTEAAIPEGVTAIGSYAFDQCTNLTSVTIPKSVTSIGACSFRNCTGVTAFTVSADNANYSSDENGVLYTKDRMRLIQYPAGNPHTSFSVPIRLAIIDDYAFFNCANLVHILMPDSVTRIGEYAFCGCTALLDVVIPSKVPSILSSTFQNCTSLTDVTIPQGVTSLYNYAFTNCTSLSNVVLPDGMTTIYYYVFKDCTSLAYVHIPASVTTINSPTFSNNSSSFYICSDTADCYAKTYANNKNIEFRVCDGHAPHVHEYTAAVTTEPTCIADGVKTYTCAGCGDSYTEAVAALGHNYNGVVTAPTCTAGGYTTYTCTRCGDAYTADETPATGHNYNGVVTAPTCTAGGFTTYTCVRCGDSYTADETPATGHNYTATVTTDPTCTSEGVRTYTCANCDDRYTEAIAALGHNYNGVVTEPTCTARGYTTYTCARCGDSYTADETPATAHDYTAAVTTDPTCFSEGVRTYTCTACGYSYTEAIAMIAHNYTSAVTLEPTCTECGVETFTCTVCGYSYTDYITWLGHDYVGVEVIPTCTLTGYTIYTCSRCDDSYTADETPATGHDFVEDSKIEPTCTADGAQRFFCLYCNCTYTETIPALGHNYNAVVTDPACTTVGYTTFTCSRCGDSYTADETPATGHNYSSVVTAPTCTESGFTTYTCSRCGDSYTADETPATGHDFGEWIVTTEPTVDAEGEETRTCSRCGATEKQSVPRAPLGGECGAQGDNVLWTLNTDSGLITIFGSGEMADFEHGSEPWAAYRDLIQSVVIRDGVTSVGVSSFCECNNVASASIANTVTSIGSRAFQFCEKMSCVTIPDSVTSIGQYAFSYCTDLVDVTIGRNTASIGQDVFYRCPNILAFSVDSDNASFCNDESGVLYNKAKTVLVKYPVGNPRTAYTIADTVTVIGASAFDGASSLTRVTITSAVTEIKPSAFAFCTNLADFTIPNTVHTIGSGAFKGCTAFSSITVPNSVTVLGGSVFLLVDKVIYNGVSAGSPWGAVHHYRYAVTAPTCAAEGYTTYTCTVCGDSCTEAIAALGHNYNGVVTEPTCTAGGYTTFTCSRCGDSYTADETPALGHDFGNWVVTKPATVNEAGEETRTCSRCGAAETRPIPKLDPAAAPAITLSGAAVARGRQVTLTLSVKNNPGLVAALIGVSYDPAVLRLVDVKDGGLLGTGNFYPGRDITAIPYTLLWEDSYTHESYTANGTLAALTFEVLDDAPLGETTITLTCGQDSTVDVNLDEVGFTLTNATVNVVDRIPGDVNDDGAVNLKDVITLRRFLSGGWDVTIHTLNADVNADGSVNAKDVVLLRRYLSGGWDIVLL